MLGRKILKEGPDPTILFLHGFLGRSEDWLEVVSHLPPCTCIGIDLPGHGTSPFELEFDIDVSHCHIVGYSMGGRIALQYLAEKALSLTLLSVHPGLEDEEEKKKRILSDTKWAELLLRVPIDEFLTAWYDQTIFKPFKPDFSLRKDQNIQGLASALLRFSLAKQKRFEIEEVLVGERDAKFLSLYKRPIVIPNAGHMIHFENPKAVAEIIKQRVKL
jgi:2-succinyl-6-hydroxy-2,4-cyclohexadiene-1-carboxylate synthase